MGHVGIVTWNGYDTHQPGHNKEGRYMLQVKCVARTNVCKNRNLTECKSIWWGHVHDGPINCIKRNAFYPDMHLVCGGHVVSIWSLNYEVNLKTSLDYYFPRQFKWTSTFKHCTRNVMYSQL